MPTDFSELLADLVGVERDEIIVVAVVAGGRSSVSADRYTGGVVRPVAMPAPKRQRHIATGWSNLTERERAVALLAGQAMTNQQIANRLHISPHTVNYHLRQIFKKLAIDSRVSLAGLVHDQPWTQTLESGDGPGRDAVDRSLGAR